MGRALKPEQRLRPSAHVSFFHRSGEVFLYHDLWGYVLAMDARTYAFFRGFDGAPRIATVTERFADRLPLDQMDGFVHTFYQHRALVPRSRDEERDAFLHGHPSRGPWLLSWQGAKDRTILGYRDRGLGRIVLDPLTGRDAEIFELSDGDRTLAEIASELADRHLEADLWDLSRAVRHTVFRLAHSDRQVLKLTERPLFTYLQFAPSYLRTQVPFPRLPDGADPEALATPAATVVDLGRYHREEIDDANEQFEVQETTLSHMFRDPHPALGGRSYGEAVARSFERRGILPKRGRIVEVGGGVGFFAQRFQAALCELRPGRELSYTILDLSPALHRSQKRLEAALGGGVRFVRADASRRLPFAAESIDLLISNEVIGDLETVRLVQGERPEADATGDAVRVRAGWEGVRRWGLDLHEAPTAFWLNLGALQLVEDLARVLRPGGAAWLSEFGELDAYPVESIHLDHAEFSIHFGHLLQAARAAGLEAEVVSVPAEIGLVETVRCLQATRTFFEALRALCAQRGIRLEKRPYTPEEMRALFGDQIRLEDLRGIGFTPAGHRVLGLRPHEFKALVVRRPGTGESPPVGANLGAGS